MIIFFDQNNYIFVLYTQEFEIRETIRAVQNSDKRKWTGTLYIHCKKAPWKEKIDKLVFNCQKIFFIWPKSVNKLFLKILNQNNYFFVSYAHAFSSLSFWSSSGDHLGSSIWNVFLISSTGLPWIWRATALTINLTRPLISKKFPAI